MVHWDKFNWCFWMETCPNNKWWIYSCLNKYFYLSLDTFLAKNIKIHFLVKTTFFFLPKLHEMHFPSIQQNTFLDKKHIKKISRQTFKNSLFRQKRKSKFFAKIVKNAFSLKSQKQIFHQNWKNAFSSLNRKKKKYFCQNRKNAFSCQNHKITSSCQNRK